MKVITFKDKKEFEKYKLREGIYLGKHHYCGNCIYYQKQMCMNRPYSTYNGIGKMLPDNEGCKDWRWKYK